MIHYPYYHPNRSRFFNTATFFVKTVEGLNGGIKNLLNSKQFLRINPQNVGFINYVKWEESGGKELQLPGFFLTNQQMYWVARAHVSFTKHHPHGSLHENPNYYSFLKNFHIFYKNNLLFRKTFNCSEPTKEEEKKTLKYEKELKEGSLKKTQKYANS